VKPARLRAVFVIIELFGMRIFTNAYAKIPGSTITILTDEDSFVGYVAMVPRPEVEVDLVLFLILCCVE
jgi:hypothetical protein